jgi:hypothetical protein
MNEARSEDSSLAIFFYVAGMLYKMPISGFDSIFIKLRKLFGIYQYPVKTIFHWVVDSFTFPGL